VTLRWLLAAVHLLGLAVGLGAIWARARAFRGRLDAQGIQQALYADNWWGISALLLIGTGLIRAFSGYEKGSDYYLQSDLFWAKMVLVVLVLALEVPPMLMLIRWRVGIARGTSINPAPARRYAATSTIQGWLLVLILMAATGMARGYTIDR
jgi:putative membrane protein